MTLFQIVYWRDIPVQVRVKNGRTRLSQPLTPRFQKAVYRAAYRAKAITGDAYAESWRPSDWQESNGNLDETLAAAVAELESAYDDERLNVLALNKGYDSYDN